MVLSLALTFAKPPAAPHKSVVQEMVYAPNGFDVITLQSGQLIVRAQNFLPENLAQTILEGIRSNLSKWDFATNDGNRKVKGTTNIKQRREVAEKKMKLGAFAYAKFELNLQSPLHKTILKMFSSGPAGRAITRALAEIDGGKAPTHIKLTDLFLAKYEQGNFLSAHNDASLGSVSFTLNLTPDWQSVTGGDLWFYCRSNLTWCHSEAPAWNTLLVFRSWPSPITHKVSMVQNGRRFSITGWYANDKARRPTQNDAQCKFVNS